MTDSSLFLTKMSSIPLENRVIGKEKNAHFIKHLNDLKSPCLLLSESLFEFPEHYQELCSIVADEASPVFQYGQRIQSSCEIEARIQDALGQLEKQNDIYLNDQKLRFLTNELLSNAFFHGVKSSYGQSAKLNRKGDFSLVPGQKIELFLECYPNILSVQVRDPFGGLKLADFAQNLNRSYTEKRIKRKGQGAGLGLYFIYENSQFLQIKVREKKETIINSMIFYKLRPKYRKTIATSFYFERS